MRPKITSQEREQLSRLLAIVQDESRSIDERALAKIKFEQIYEKACNRTATNSQKRHVAYA